METNYPELNFILDKEMDYWTAGEFLTFKDEEDKFTSSILETHPGLNVLKDKPKDKWSEIIRACVDSYYQSHETEISKARTKAQRE